MNTIRATMTTAAMATMATVDAATITRGLSPLGRSRKPLHHRRDCSDCASMFHDLLAEAVRD